MLRTAFALVITGLLVAACGSSTSDRALSGGALGAGAGGAVGAVTGLGTVEGALLGAAAGALTDEEDIDLGEPVWD